MSLGSLPHLPTKVNLVSTVDPDELGGGDFLLRSTGPNEKPGLLEKPNGYPDQDGCTFYVPGKDVWNLPDGKRSQSETGSTARPRKCTENRDNSFLSATQSVCNVKDNVDEAMKQSPITRAILRGEHSLVLESLRQGENPNSVCSKSSQSYLHIISWHASSDNETAMVPMVYQLSNAGIDLNHKDISGHSSTRVAIRRKLIQVLAALLKCGAELGVAELEEAELVRGVVRTDILEVVRRFHPGYWEAVLDPNPFKVSRLVKAWARINVSRPGQNLTLIEFAKKNARDEAVVKLLLQHEVSIELAHAVMAGDSQQARVLLCNGGADLSTADYSVRSATLHTFTPLSLNGAAEKYGHIKVLRLLQAKEASIVKSTTNSPVRDPWSSGDSFVSKRPGDRLKTDDRLAYGPPASAMCTIL